VREVVGVRVSQEHWMGGPIGVGRGLRVELWAALEAMFCSNLNEHHEVNNRLRKAQMA
jgi:hypothetical protein